MLKKTSLAIVAILFLSVCVLIARGSNPILHAVNGVLADSGISIRSYRGLSLGSGHVQLGSVDILYLGRVQRVSGVRVEGQILAGQIDRIKIASVELDLLDLDSYAPTKHTSDLSSADSSAQIVLPQLKELAYLPEFQMTVQSVHIKQRPKLGNLMAQVHVSPNQISIQVKSQDLRFELMLLTTQTDAVKLEIAVLQEGPSAGANPVLAWQIDCQQSISEMACQYGLPVDLSSVGPLLIALQNRELVDRSISVAEISNLGGAFSLDGSVTIPASVKSPEALVKGLVLQAGLTIQQPIIYQTSEILIHTRASEPLHLAWQEGRLVQISPSQESLVGADQGGYQEEPKGVVFHLAVFGDDPARNPASIDVNIDLSEINCVLLGEMSCRLDANLWGGLNAESIRAHPLFNLEGEAFQFDQLEWRLPIRLQLNTSNVSVSLRGAGQSTLKIEHLKYEDISVDQMELVAGGKGIEKILEYDVNSGDVHGHLTRYALSMSNVIHSAAVIDQVDISASNLVFKQRGQEGGQATLTAESMIELKNIVIAEQVEEAADAMLLDGFKVAGNWSLADQQFDFRYSVSNRSGTSLLNWVGSYTLNTGNTFLNWQLNDVPLTESEPLHQTVGLNELPVWVSTGTLKGQGWVNVRDQITMAGELTLVGLGGHVEEYPFSGVNGQFLMNFQNDELRYVSSGKLNIAQFDVGLPVGPIEMSLSGSTLSNIILLNDFRAVMMGGELRLSRYRLDLNKDEHNGVLELEGLNFKDIFAYIDSPSLSGQGKLNGRLPFSIKGAEFLISKGEVYGLPPGGVIRYEDPSMASAQAGMGVNFAYSALSNYHYNQLVSQVELTTEGKLLLDISMKGSNPDFENGRPIHLNLKLDDNIMAQMRSYNAVNNITDKLENIINKQQ